MDTKIIDTHQISKCYKDEFTFSLKQLILFFLVFFVQTTLYGSDTEIILRSAGCKTEFFLIRDLITGYRIKTSQGIQIKKTGNKKATELLLKGDIDFSFTCKKHKKLVKKFGYNDNGIKNWHCFKIASDPIVLVSNVENTIDNLSMVQIRDIFTGKITNWNQIGGKNLPITVAYLEDSLESGVVTVFKEITTGVKQKLYSGAKKLLGPSNLGYFVKLTPGAITFMGYKSYQKKYGNLLKVNSIGPSCENIQNSKYPLVANYYLTYNIKTHGEKMKPFLDYIKSEEGTQLINTEFIAAH